MSKLLFKGCVVLASLCLASAALAKNIKVVCQNDVKHDKAKLIKAMQAAKKGDKLVIIGICQPKGVTADARKAYTPRLGGVEVYTTTNPHLYDSWRFDSVILYDRRYNVPVTNTTIIDSKTTNLKESHTTTETSHEKASESNHHDEEGQSKDVEEHEEPADANPSEEGPGNDNSDEQEGPSNEDSGADEGPSNDDAGSSDSGGGDDN